MLRRKLIPCNKNWATQQSV